MNKKIKIILGIICGILVTVLIVLLCLLFSDNSDDAGNDQPISDMNTGSENYDRTTQPGDVMEFGTYEQDGNLTNGSEPIEWLVLQVVDNKALLITKDSIGATKYTDNSNGSVWENSFVYNWMNDFAQSAFSEQEKNLITQECICAEHSVYCTENDVFALSSDEIKNFAETVPHVYVSTPTEYAKQQGVLSYINLDEANYPEYTELNGNSIWWLRSDYRNGCVMTPYGVSYVPTDYENRPVYAIRPSIWISVGEQSEKPVYGASSIDELNMILSEYSFNEKMVETMTVGMQLWIFEEQCGGNTDNINFDYFNMIINNEHEALSVVYDGLYSDQQLFKMHINSYEKVSGKNHYYSNEYNNDDYTNDDIIDDYISMCGIDSYMPLYNELYINAKKEINHIEEIWVADITIYYDDGTHLNISPEDNVSFYDPTNFYIYKINGRYFWAMIEMI